MGGILQGDTERKRSSKMPRAIEFGSDRGGRGGERTGRKMETAMYNMKTDKATDEVRLDMMDRTATERVYA